MNQGDARDPWEVTRRFFAMNRQRVLESSCSPERRHLLISRLVRVLSEAASEQVVSLDPR